MRNNVLWCICILLLIAATPLKSQKLAGNLDVTWLCTGILGAGAEMTVARSSTVNLSVLTAKHPWVYHDLSGVLLQPEWRYYLSERPMFHHFVGIGGIIGTYETELETGKYVGSVVGIGVTFGYVLPLNKYLNLDLHSGLALIHREDREHGIDNFTLPTKAGISLTYIFR